MASIFDNMEFKLWSPELGITNLYNEQTFSDPFSLSLEQVNSKPGEQRLDGQKMDKIKKWGKAIDVLNKSNYVQGVPDVATKITGYEIKQKGVGDCSVLCSLAVTAHHEMKHDYKVKIISSKIFP